MLNPQENKRLQDLIRETLAKIPGIDASQPSPYQDKEYLSADGDRGPVPGKELEFFQWSREKRLQELARMSEDDRALAIESEARLALRMDS